MAKTTVSKVLKWLEKPYGATVRDDRDDLVDVMNRIVEEAFNAFPMQSTFLDVEQCFNIQGYSVECYDCEDTYYGVSLPYDMQHVTAAWLNQEPINLYSKWREADVGRRVDKCVSLCTRSNMYDMAGTFPTERDLCKSLPMNIWVTCESGKDYGKEVLVKVSDKSGREHKLSFVLGSEPVISNEYFVKIESVILPEDLSGRVTLTQDGTRVLSHYHPKEHVPAYKRVKIEGLNCSHQVFIRAARKRIEYCCDDDILPIDSRRFFEEGARYLRALDDGSTGEQLNKASVHRELMLSALQAYINREEGDIHDDILNFRVGRVRTSKLNRS